MEIKEKIKHLFETNGRTEEEVASYAAKARELMDKHNLKMEDISGKSKDDIFDREFLAAQSRREAWTLNLAVSVATFNDCKVYMNVGSDGRAVKMVGYEVDLTLTRRMFEYLFSAASRLWEVAANEAKRSGEIRTRKESFAFKKGYLLGFTQRLNSRLTDLRNKSLKGDVACRDLVVVRIKDVESWMEDSLNLRKAKKKKVDIGNADAYWKGYSDGENVSLNKQVA